MASCAPDVFATQIGGHDFFRIEGHLGQKVDSVSATLKAAIASANLPLAVRTALLHNDRKKIVIRPPRYGDLHRFHYLVRKEVTAQLDFGKQCFSACIQYKELIEIRDSLNAQTDNGFQFIAGSGQ